jgi:hypothetical protein
LGDQAGRALSCAAHVGGVAREGIIAAPGAHQFGSWTQSRIQLTHDANCVAASGGEFLFDSDLAMGRREVIDERVGEQV